MTQSLKDSQLPKPCDQRADAEPEQQFADDERIVAAQLGRSPRGMRAVAHRCPCGLPDVVETEPRLADGTPFPTFYYLTCPRAVSAVSTMETSGLMREMSQRLIDDSELAQQFADAHHNYLQRRAEAGQVTEISDTSAGGMPHRVKCLHALVAHSLATGPGINPLGDEALAALPQWWANGCCIQQTNQSHE